MNQNGTDQKLTGYQESLPPARAGRKPEPRRNSPKADSSSGAPPEKDGQTLPNVNRCFKDRIFRLVFSEKENLLSLYNAVSGTGYSDPDELIIYTLEDAVYLGIKNDLGFLLHTQLSLYEHQSTICYNMPLRGLQYFAGMYRSYVKLNGYDPTRKSVIPLPSPPVHCLLQRRR